MKNKWINMSEERPTKEDGDGSGNILAIRYVDGIKTEICFANYAYAQTYPGIYKFWYPILDWYNL